MRANCMAAGLVAAMASITCVADDLTAAKAAELLQPYMTNDCGNYYTTQGEPDFADLDDKAMCVYQPRITSIKISGNTAAVAFNKDRHFTEEMSQAWLKDYAKMEAHQAPSPMFKALKKNLDKWRAESGGVDSGDRFGSATFKLDGGTWKIDGLPE